MKSTRQLRYRRFGLAAVALWGGVLVSSVAWARPGGGHSFGGGHSGGGGGGGGGSGGGGGGAELIYLFFRLHIYLLFDVPVVGVPIVLAEIGLLVWYFRNSKTSNLKDWSTVEVAQHLAPEDRARVSRAAWVTPILQVDPAFSFAVLEDFLYSLYPEVHRARAALSTVAGFVSPAASATLAALSKGPVADVVVGAMKMTFLQRAEERDRFRVDFTANYTDGGQAYYTEERWFLSRKVGVTSHPPTQSRTFGCPQCGAALTEAVSLSAGVCPYCKGNVALGAFDWWVDRIDVLARNPRAPLLTRTTEEEGTDNPTRFEPDVEAERAALLARDPALSPAAIEARTQLIFSLLQEAWSTQKWQRARGVVSDNLFQTLSYWIDAYRKQGLRNVTENARILRVEWAGVVHDQFFDAVTLRVFATSLDYTLSQSTGKVVGGSKSKERAYSEYWTLLRGAKVQGAPRTEPICPQCGAELNITMAGNCEYCKSKVVTGEFDWVLSRIEQDD